MIRSGEAYREGLRDGREVWIDGERVADVTRHPAFRPVVDIRARLYDMQHEAAHQPVLTYLDGKDRHAIVNRLPKVTEDWDDKWRAVDCFLQDIGGGG